jgi:hypothetical protein
VPSFIDGGAGTSRPQPLSASRAASLCRRPGDFEPRVRIGAVASGAGFFLVLEGDARRRGP